MSQALQKYLDRVMIYANRNETDAVRVRAELEDHLLKKIAELEAKGVEHADAIFQAIEEFGRPRTVGYGLRPKFPLVDVRTYGTARGFIAVGPKAVGVIAMGGVAIGVISIGGIGIGLLTCAGFGLALLVSFAGFAFAPVGFAYGGFALGLVAVGGFSCGIVSNGGLAIGLWVPAAGKALSYFSAENVPEKLRQIGTFVSTRDLLAIKTVMGISYTILFGGLILHGILASKERSRLKKADPTLVE